MDAPYQSEVPNLTEPTIRRKEKNESADKAYNKVLTLLLKCQIKMLLKCHLIIKWDTNYQGMQTLSEQFGTELNDTSGYMGMHCACPGDNHCLSRIQSHFPGTLQLLVVKWRWHHSNQSGVISITKKLVINYREKLRGVWEEQQWSKNTAQMHPCHHVNLIARTVIHNDMM